ncbi:MAG: hypothetical protein NT166_06970 [Candidatus Aminicenantes bacterium]|nr:hypothetical protein [Candidatus Aminicenantes bacterium]
MRKSILLLAVLSLMVVMSSCQKSEEVTVTKYFEAMQHNDRDTMSAMALEPKDIEYKSYEILSIDAPVTKELELPVLLKKLADTEKGKKEQVTKAMDKAEGLQDAQDELDETRGGGKKAELQNKIATLKAESDAETQKVRIMQLDINRLKKAIDREKALITLSTAMRDNLEMFSGETASIKVTAKVTLQNNEVKNYIFLLRKDTLILEGKKQLGRLVIIKLMTAEEYEKSLKQKDEEEKIPVVTAKEVEG